MRFRGNELELEHPYSVSMFIAIGVIYWLIRYYQYLQELGGLGLNQRHDEFLNRRLYPIAKKKLQAKADEEQPENQIRVIQIYGLNHKLTHLGFCQLTFGATARDSEKTMNWEGNVFKVPDKELRWPNILAAIDVTFRSNMISEYYLPIFLPLGVSIYGYYSILRFMYHY